MEDFNDALHNDLDADAEGEEGDHLVDDHTARAAQLFDDFFALGQKQIQNRAHDENDDGDNRVIDSALQQRGAFGAGGCHEGKNNRNGTRTDADGKGERIENCELIFDRATGSTVLFSLPPMDESESLSHCKAVLQISKPPPNSITGTESPNSESTKCPIARLPSPISR